MGFLQLLSALLVFGFALASLLYFRLSKETHWLYWGIGFSVYCVALILEIALGFVFNEHILRYWYWLRQLVFLPIFAQGLLHFLYKDHPWRRYVEWAIWLALLVGLGLILLTAITEAVDWYEPSQTIYTQYVDLLARNRPTRWLTYLMNGVGVGVALFALGRAFIQKLDVKNLLSFFSIGLGFAIILLQDIVISTGLIWAVWLVPILGCTFLFIGVRWLTVETVHLANEDNPQNVWLGIH